MSTSSIHPIVAASQTPLSPLLRQGERFSNPELVKKSPVEKAEDVKEAFTDFIGKTFFSQMLKAMRTSVGKPAYFHGGQAEEIFQSQLDQTLTDTLSEASADTIADPLFELQFPRQAKILKDHAAAQATGKANVLLRNTNTLLPLGTDATLNSMQEAKAKLDTKSEFASLNALRRW